MLLVVIWESVTVIISTFWNIKKRKTGHAHVHVSVFANNLVRSPSSPHLWQSTSWESRLAVDLLSVVVFWERNKAGGRMVAMPCVFDSGLYSPVPGPRAVPWNQPLGGCLTLCLSQLLGYSSLSTHRQVLESQECPNQSSPRDRPQELQQGPPPTPHLACCCVSLSSAQQEGWADQHEVNVLRTT